VATPPTTTVDLPPVTSAVSGTRLTLSAAATGNPAPRVRWLSSREGQVFAPIPGADEPTLTIPAVTPDMAGTQYVAVFTNPGGLDATQRTTLAVESPPADGPTPQPTDAAGPSKLLPVSDLRARVKGKKVRLGWSNPPTAAAVAAYRVQMKPPKAAWRTVGTTRATSFTLRKPRMDGLYRFRVVSRSQTDQVTSKVVRLRVR
jgi:hypothetical protein